MDTKEILSFCIGKGILLDNEVLSLFSEAKNSDSVKLMLSKVIEKTSQKIITKKVFQENEDAVMNALYTIPGKDKEYLEELTIKLGLSLEISSKRKALDKKEEIVSETGMSPVKIFAPHLKMDKKLEVKDFTNHFRNRFSEIRDFLKEHPKLTNLVSIGKVSRDNQRISVIGMIYSKKVTKNKNIIFEVEDHTGKINILVTLNKPELYNLAEEVTLDSVLGFTGFGNKEILFANDIVFPDMSNLSQKKAPIEEHALFISDVHVGTERFMEKNFLKFINYLNGNIPGTSGFDKVKYLFIVGDLVAGVGEYPNQDKDLAIKDIEGQYIKLAEYLKMIRKDIQIIILPGNHDCVRLMEPQPVLDEKFAWPLYELENALFASSPSIINIGARGDFEGFNILAYHGFSYTYYAKTVPSLIKEDAVNSPNKIIEYLLKNRHLAPTHTSVQYFPSEKDNLLIRFAPDVVVSGHLHKSTVSKHNGITVISNSCWEELYAYQEKYGCKPDYCKVPSFNLKTGEVKILDFE